MSTLHSDVLPRPRWLTRLVHLEVGTATVLLISAWIAIAFEVRPHWLPLLLSGVAAFLSGTAFAINIRPQPGRLLGFGRDKVQVRSLDEWTLYQYDVPFDKASAEQQKEALNHYRVGLRLFPARPQDRVAKQGVGQWLFSLLTFSSFMTLSQAVHGWSVLLLLAAFYGWIWLCMRWSKRFYEVPATNGLIGLDL